MTKRPTIQVLAQVTGLQENALDKQGKSEHYRLLELMVQAPLLEGCTRCGDCCSRGNVPISPLESQIIAYFLGHNDLTKAQYQNLIFEEDALKKPCHFLTRKKDGSARCIIYPVRPYLCRLFGAGNHKGYECYQHKVYAVPSIAYRKVQSLKQAYFALDPNYHEKAIEHIKRMLGA